MKNEEFEIICINPDCLQKDLTAEWGTYRIKDEYLELLEDEIPNPIMISDNEYDRDAYEHLTSEHGKWVLLPNHICDSSKLDSIRTIKRIGKMPDIPMTDEMSEPYEHELKDFIDADVYVVTINNGLKTGVAIYKF